MVSNFSKKGMKSESEKQSLKTRSYGFQFY